MVKHVSASLVVATVSAWLSLQADCPAADSGNVTLIPAPSGGTPIVARCDAGGAIHLLCSAKAGPYYVRSTDGGQTFGQPLAIVDLKGQKAGLEFDVWDMAVSRDGTVHAALGTNAWKLKLPQEEWGFYYTRLDPAAKAFTPAANINRKPSEGFSLAADDRGNVTACWLSDKLYANVSHDGGRTFGPNVEINPDYNPCNCCTTSICYGADGRLAVLYREETNNERDMFLALWDQAKNQTSRTRISTTLWKLEACPMSYYTIVPQDNGFVATWPTKGDVYFARLDAKGNLQSPGEIKVPGQAGMRTGALTLTDKSGNTLVAWKKSDQLGWQLYDAKGQPSGRAGSAKSPGSGAAGVLTKDGRFVLFR